MKHRVVLDKKKKRKNTAQVQRIVNHSSVPAPLRTLPRLKKKKKKGIRDRQANLDLKGHGVIVRKKEG